MSKYIPAGSAFAGTAGGILLGWGLARYWDPKCLPSGGDNRIVEDTGKTTTWILIILGIILILISGGSAVYFYNTPSTTGVKLPGGLVKAP